jgi:di/tricarboxylate transporter
MGTEQFAQDTKIILGLIETHAARIRATRPGKTKIERRSSWLTGLGATIFIIFLGLAHLYGSSKSDLTVSWAIVIVGAMCLGVLLMLIGLVLDGIHFRRTMKQPLVEHTTRIIDALPADTDLLTGLVEIEVSSLEFARKRLSIESTKVRSRLERLGGGSRVKASLAGVAFLCYLLVQQYIEVDFAALEFTNVTLLGLALLVGVSIAAWYVSSGAGEGDYYGEFIDLALQIKKTAESVASI